MNEDIDEEVIEFNFDEVLDALSKYSNPLTIAGIIISVITCWYVRTQNIINLKNKYLLALDPYIFLRYARTIVEKGFLPAIDNMRHYPIFFDTSRELLLPTHFIVFIYRILHFFNSSVTVNYAAIIYPPIVTCIGIIFFYLLVKDLFNNSTAFIATMLLATIQGFLFRTSAGFAEKEPVAIFFIFPFVFFYLRSLRNKNLKKKIIYGVLANIFLIGTVLSWGGTSFNLISIGFLILASILLNKTSREDSIIIFLSCLSIFTVTFITGRFGSGLNIFKYYAFLWYPLVLFLNLFKFEVYPRMKNIFKDYKPKFLSENFYSIILGIGFLLIITLIFPGPSYYNTMMNFVFDKLNHPMGSNPFSMSVSENQPPYFIDPIQHVDWWSPLNYAFFTMLFGSLLLFYHMLKHFKKSRWVLTITYSLTILLFIFSRYSSENTPVAQFINSLFSFSFLGLELHHYILFAFLGYLAFFYFVHNKQLSKLKNINIDYLFVFIWFLITVIAARGGVRIIFTVIPPAMILSAFFFTKSYEWLSKFLDSKSLASIVYVMAGIIIIFNFIGSASANANFYSSFTPEWDESMTWVQNNTPEDSVFIHWWDYGYWVQTMGRRTTILDGGNYYVGWNHLTGRYIFASRVYNPVNDTYNMTEPATVLAENFEKPDYFLVIDDDVFKYVQMGRIGKRPTYYSAAAFEQKIDNNEKIGNTTIFPEIAVYRPLSGGIRMHEEFFYDDFIFSPDKTYIINILVPYNSDSGAASAQMYAAVYNPVYNPNNYVVLPYNCRCVHEEGCKFIRNDGIPACAISMPDGIVHIPKNASNNLFTQLYLVKDDVPGFELAYDNPRPLNLRGMYSQSITDLKIYRINYSEMNEYILDEPLPSYWKEEGLVYW